MSGQSSSRTMTLREALRTVLVNYPGYSVAGLARVTGWSASSVRRELNVMEQLGIVRSWKSGRARSWALTRPAARPSS